VLARVSLAESIRENTPLAWWAALRDRVQVEAREIHRGQFAIDVQLGKAYRGAGIASVIKPLLDGLVSALHSHDGSSHEVIAASLGDVGDAERLWRLLNDPAGAILGRRRLVRPHGSRTAWNPADELCGAFRVTRGNRQDVLTAVVAAMDHSTLPPMTPPPAY